MLVSRFLSNNKVVAGRGLGRRPGPVPSNAHGASKELVIKQRLQSLRLFILKGRSNVSSLQKKHRFGSFILRRIFRKKFLDSAARKVEGRLVRSDGRVFSKVGWSNKSWDFLQLFGSSTVGDKSFMRGSLLKRIFRNSLFYSGGTFRRSGRFFLRSTKRLNWLLIYSFYVNRISSLYLSPNVLRLGLTLEDRYIKKNLQVNRKGKSFISGQGVFDSSSYLKNRGFLNLRDFNLRFSKSIFSKSARTRPLLESRFLRSGCSSYKRRDFAPFLQGRRPTHSSLRESDFELVQSPYFDEVEYSGKSSTTDKFNRLLLLPGLRPSSSLEDKNISEAGFLSMTFCKGLESQPFDVLSFIFRERYGLSLSKSVSGAGEKALIDEKRMQYSSLRYQGSLTYRYFPDANKIVRPGVPNNDFYGCYRPLLLLLRFFPTVTITFRANNVFFVLSSVEGKVVVSHSVGCGGEFTKSKRRAVFAYDAASREFAKKVRSITSVVGIRVYGQSKRRFYVLRNIKQEGIRFVFLHDIVPFACNGVKKSRPARKRR